MERWRVLFQDGRETALSRFDIFFLSPLRFTNCSKVGSLSVYFHLYTDETKNNSWFFGLKESHRVIGVYVFQYCHFTLYS